MTERKYLHTLGELIDRLAIVQLKEIYIPANKEAYRSERAAIMHDIEMTLPGLCTAEFVHAVMVIMLTNHYIWVNEGDVRKGRPDGENRLRATHMVNGVRNAAKNAIARQTGERVDLKVDCLAADLQEFFGQNWDVFS